MRHMIAVRKEHPVFGRGSFAWVSSTSSAVIAYERVYQGERVLIVNNLASEKQVVDLTVTGIQSAQPVDLLTGDKPARIKNEKLNLNLESHRYLWLKL
jgi:maltose alpha-D-glucosyltransferase/alpha-amylase